MFRLFKYGLLLSLALNTATGFAADQDSARKAVEQRAHDYMEALRVNDLHTAYRLSSGALDGSVMAYDFYRRFVSAPAELLAFNIEDVELDDDGQAATVQMQVTYDYPQLYKPYSRSKRLPWVLIDGQWYQDTGGH